MRYLSVCSGIESASVAWSPLGWTPIAFAETEPFARAVLAHHYADAVNLGDINEFADWPDAVFDVLVGGTPCQSFSVAGLRAGLADPRGNLALVYLAIVDRYRPRWLVWENVPGVLSSNDGRDFGAFVGGLAKLGYGFAYRVLDAQYVRVDGFHRAVPQRRRRVFVIGYLGDWRRAATVLFERESMQWNSAPRRTAGQGFAADVVASLVSSGRGVERAGETRGQDPVVAVDVPEIVSQAVSSKWHKGSSGPSGDEVVNLIAVADPICANEARTYTHEGRNNFRLRNVVAFDLRGREGGVQFEGPHHTANIRAASGGSSRSYVSGLRVRRLTVEECEALQGLPRGYTRVPYPAMARAIARSATLWRAT
jgi:DNA (cytosine-5)-methyltransferase 1